MRSSSWTPRAVFVLALALTDTCSAAAIRLDGATRTLERRAAEQPFNVLAPGPTPAFTAPAAPILLSLDQVTNLISATSSTGNSVTGQAVTGATRGALCVPGLLSCVSPGNGPPPPSNVPCLDSAYDERTINTLFKNGGANTTVFLCPDAVISLYTGPIQFTAPFQTLTTYVPPGSGPLPPSRRAIVRLSGSGLSCAIYTADAGRDGATISNIQVDGNRPNLGYLQGGLALIEAGGTNAGQRIENVNIFEPRAWSALHIIEGSGNSCTGAVVKGNTIGPAGQAPTGPTQYRAKKRDSASYPPGQWADGISLSCRNSIVTDNIITDATDGGIVIFGSPGSLVQGNTIQAVQRQLLGGINAVDYNPWQGSFQGLQVQDNRIHSESVMIKIGLAIGQLSWTDRNNTRTQAGLFQRNVFSSGGSGYFGYGVTVAGHDNAAVQANRFVNANFGGLPTDRCILPLVPVGPLYQNQYTTPAAQLQSEFVQAGAFQFMICNGPGPIVQANVNS